MRIDLTTTYPERHKAKALGARWDAFKRVWYVIDPPDLTPFLRWIAAEKLQPVASVGPPDPADQLWKPAPAYSALSTELEKVEKFNLRKRITGPAQVAHCGCDVLPWEHCLHTLANAGGQS